MGGAEAWGGAYPMDRCNADLRLVLLHRQTFDPESAPAPLVVPRAKVTLLHEVAHHVDVWLRYTGWNSREAEWMGFTGSLQHTGLPFPYPYRKHMQNPTDQAAEDWADALMLSLLEPDRLNGWSPERHDFMQRMCDERGLR